VPDRRRGEVIPVVAVRFDRTADRSLLGLAASEENPDDVFVVARAHRVGAQEAALGMDTYCLITGSSGATHYGGVEDVDWPEPTHLRLDLTAAAAEALALPRCLELRLPEADVALVRTELPALLA
jgi:hypothetical protein